MITLVCGLPGSGKTTWAKNHMTQDTLVYDLDAIAGAFRLTTEHTEYNSAARRMANDFLRGFLIRAEDYADDIIVIRTAPSIEEVEQIDPDMVVICCDQYIHRPMDDEEAAKARIDELIEWCREYAIRMRKHS